MTTTATLPEAYDRRSYHLSLWLHRVVAEYLDLAPDKVLPKAQANLDHMRETHPNWYATWAPRWRNLLEQGPAAVRAMLVAVTEEACEFRHNSILTGVLEPGERDTVVNDFGVWWAEHGNGRR